MSCEFWSVLGRLTCDAKFRTEVFSRAVDGANLMPQVGALYGYLTSQGYRLDRYHFMEANRVVSTRLPDGRVVGGPGGPFELVGRATSALCSRPSTQDDLYILLGVSYIDRPLRRELHEAARSGDGRAFEDLLARPPGFSLSAVNRRWLPRLYARQEVVAAFQSINDWAWRIPPGTLPDDAACDAGLTLDSYKHTSQLELRRMRLELPELRRRAPDLGAEEVGAGELGAGWSLGHLAMAA